MVGAALIPGAIRTKFPQMNMHSFDGQYRYTRTHTHTHSRQRKANYSAATNEQKATRPTLRIRSELRTLILFAFNIK